MVDPLSRCLQSIIYLIEIHCKMVETGFNFKHHRQVLVIIKFYEQQDICRSMLSKQRYSQDGGTSQDNSAVCNFIVYLPWLSLTTVHRWMKSRGTPLTLTDLGAVSFPRWPSSFQLMTCISPDIQCRLQQHQNLFIWEQWLYKLSQLSLLLGLHVVLQKCNATSILIFYKFYVSKLQYSCLYLKGISTFYFRLVVPL